MTQTCPSPNRPRLRDHAEKLLAAFESATPPQTYAEILRATRTLMAIDRLMTQLWKTPGEKTAPRILPDDTMPVTDEVAGMDVSSPEAPSYPPNRHQRRAQASHDRQLAISPSAARPATQPSPRRETG